MVYGAIKRSVLLKNVSSGKLIQKRNTLSKKMNITRFNLNFIFLRLPRKNGPYVFGYVFWKGKNVKTLNFIR